MIPKKIHYCRFGPKKPESVIQQVILWKTFCPAYEIIEWNEGNCDLKINKWVKGAVKAKKRAFVSDYFRLKALYEEGGIYLDIDMELKQSLDSFLKNKSFRGFDSRRCLSAGIIGSISGNQDILNILNIYNNKSFDGTTINVIITPYFEKRGLKLNGLQQSIDGMMFYQSNKISFDNQDGESIVVDHHLNSRFEGEKVDHSARVYLEFLATKDKRIGVALDTIYKNYEESFILKTWSSFCKLMQKIGLMPILLILKNIFVKRK